MFASRALVHRCCIDISSNSCFTKIAFWRKWAQNCVIMEKSHLSSWRSLPDLQDVGRSSPPPPHLPRQYKLYQLVAKPGLRAGVFNRNRFPGGWVRTKSVSDLEVAMRMAETGDKNWLLRPYDIYPQYYGEPERPEQRQGRYRKKQVKKSTQRFGIRKFSHPSGSGSSENNLKQWQSDQLLGDCIRYAKWFLCPINVPKLFCWRPMRGMQSIWLNLELGLDVEGVVLELGL